MCTAQPECNRTNLRLGIDATATRLNRDKIPTFGRSTGWEKSTITNILTSPAIFGVYQPHTKHKGGKRLPAGDPVPDYFPAIIDEQTYFRIQQGRKLRRISGMGRKGDSYSNLFTKIAVCGECGQPMLFEKKGQPPRSYKYFYCRGYVTSINAFFAAATQSAFLSSKSFIGSATASIP